MGTLLITLTMALFYSFALVSHDSVTVSRHEQLDPETEAAWNLVIIHFIINTCAFLTVALQKYVL